MQDLTPQWITAIAAAAAVIGGLFGAAIGAAASVLASSRQFRAEVLSKNRQDWINTVRDTVAEIINLVWFVRMQRESQTVNAASLLEKVEKERLLYSRLLLLMNPNESDHVMLLNQIEEVIKALGVDDKLESEVKISTWSNTVVAQAQQILKREWERVKRGE